MSRLLCKFRWQELSLRDSATLEDVCYLSRVPCAGELVKMHGRPRLQVVTVEHLSTESTVEAVLTCREAP